MEDIFEQWHDVLEGNCNDKLDESDEVEAIILRVSLDTDDGTLVDTTVGTDTTTELSNDIRVELDETW